MRNRRYMQRIPEPQDPRVSEEQGETGGGGGGLVGEVGEWRGGPLVALCLLFCLLLNIKLVNISNMYWNYKVEKLLLLGNKCVLLIV